MKQSKMKNLYRHSRNSFLLIAFFTIINSIAQLNICPSVIGNNANCNSKTIFNLTNTTELIDSISQSQKLVPSKPMAGGCFGRSVYIDGDYAVVGAYRESEGGSIYIYKLEGNEWIEESQVTGSDTKAGDYFGFSVMIEGDYIVVGALYAGSFRQGAAYIYKRDGKKWNQQQRIEASDSETDSEYGVCVAIDGEYVVVGAQRHNSRGANAGSAYMYKRNGTTWTQQQKLLGDDTSTNDRLGHSVSISGDYVVIGAVLEGIGGSAYIFKRNGTKWNQQQKITSDDIQSGDYFGRPVFISGDYIIAGADQEDTGAIDAGAAYIFKRNGTKWTQEAKLQALDRDSYDRFGNAVKIEGDVAIMGAYLEGTGGSVYTFERQGTDWVQQTKFTADDIESVDNFGYGTSIFGNYIMVGAFAEDRDAMNDAGAVYVFTIKGKKANENENDDEDEDNKDEEANNQENNNNMKAYPNPNEGFLKVAFETILLEDTEVMIFDAMGRRVHIQIFEKGNKEFEVNTKKLSKGMYIIRLNQNNKIYSEQIIIE